MAIDALRAAYADEEVRELIRIREKARRDYLSGLEGAREEGREEGVQTVARRMLSEGFTLEQVQQATGASAEQLETWLAQ